VTGLIDLQLPSTFSAEVTARIRPNDMALSKMQAPGTAR
jgi:hypothetical protein